MTMMTQLTKEIFHLTILHQRQRCQRKKNCVLDDPNFRGEENNRLRFEVRQGIKDEEKIRCAVVKR